MPTGETTATFTDFYAPAVALQSQTVPMPVKCFTNRSWKLRFSYCNGEKQVAFYGLQLRTTFNPHTSWRWGKQAAAAEAGRARPGRAVGAAMPEGPGACYRLRPPGRSSRCCGRLLRWQTGDPAAAVTGRAASPGEGEARRGGAGPGRGSFRFRLPLSRPFLVPRRLSPKSRGAAVPGPAFPLPPPRLRTTGRGGAPWGGPGHRGAGRRKRLARALLERGGRLAWKPSLSLPQASLPSGGRPRPLRFSVFPPGAAGIAS